VDPGLHRSNRWNEQISFETAGLRSRVYCKQFAALNRFFSAVLSEGAGAICSTFMLNDRENILSALRVMKRADVANEEVCQSLLLKMRDEGLVKFDIHSGQWLVG
jgi:hypothetical protein